jgi:hypothetical protein
VWSTEDYVFLEGKIPRTPYCSYILIGIVLTGF